MTIQKYNVATIRNNTLSGKPIVEGKALLIEPVYEIGDSYSVGPRQYWRVQFYDDGPEGECIASGRTYQRWVNDADCYDITDPRHPNHVLSQQP